MKEIAIYKVKIHNPDRTSICFVAKSKLDTTYRYADWVKEKGEMFGVNENTDFEIEFLTYAFE